MRYILIKTITECDHYDSCADFMDHFESSVLDTEYLPIWKCYYNENLKGVVIVNNLDVDGVDGNIVIPMSALHYEHLLGDLADNSKSTLDYRSFIGFYDEDIYYLDELYNEIAMLINREDKA